jgi:hypothetical protein
MEVFIGYKDLSAKSYRVQGSWWGKNKREGPAVEIKKGQGAYG